MPQGYQKSVTIPKDLYEKAQMRFNQNKEDLIKKRIKSVTGFITNLISEGVWLNDRTYGITSFKNLDDIGAAFRLMFGIYNRSFTEHRSEMLQFFGEDQITKAKFFRAYNTLKKADFIREDENKNMSLSDMGTMVATELNRMHEIVEINELNTEYGAGFIDDESLFFTYLDERRRVKELRRKGIL